MKTKSQIFFILMLIASLSLFFIACEKEEKDSEPNVNEGSTTVQEVSADDNFQQKVSDDIMLDVEMILSGGNQRSFDWLPCNATIDSTNVINDTITYHISYHGLNCPENLYRTGQVEIMKDVNTHWYMAGASVIVKIMNLEVTRVATGQSITINGTKTHTNVTGGLLIQLGYGVNQVIHRTAGFMTIEFDDNTNRTWNIARRLVYTGTLGAFEVAMDGLGEAGVYGNLVTWGVSRSGDQFYISIPQTVTVKQECLWNPVSGQQDIEIPSENTGATITYGYDSNNQVVPPGECPVKYKVDWYVNGASGTIFLWL
ncbi:MAG: hypothetical protein R6T99_00965 [Bacteroidales bacterium]